MTDTPIIHAVGLTKVFRDFWHRARVKAVNDLDLDVYPGEIFGLLGPNGSGKSTTIKIMLGLLHPTRGRVSVFGKPPDDVKVKARIGYLPEESYLYRFLNARETLDYYGLLFQLPRRERKRRTEELLEMVGLKSAARRPVGEYSKGMARRIGLAQALINDPDLLILDEPTSGLDPIGSKLVKDIIVRIGEVHHKTIVLSSHLLADVEEVCGRVTILYGGRVQVKGTMEDVLSRRDQMQLTTDRLSEAALAEIRKIIAREGKELVVSTPRDRLESLFLRIVEQAHLEKAETHGSAATGPIAGFLAQDQGRALLESLVRGEEKPAPETRTEPVPQAVPPPRADVLRELVEEEAAAIAKPGSRERDQAKTPPARSDADVDRGLLEDLTGAREKE